MFINRYPFKCLIINYLTRLFQLIADKILKYPG